jgi:3-oxoacyl-[acyl-carrier-protein] synthase III
MGAVDLMAQAGQQAMDEAGVRRQDIDGVLCGYATTLPHLMLASLVSERMGLRPLYAHGMQMGGATGAGMVMLARELVRAGRCQRVLVLAGENRASGQSRDGAIQTLAQVGDADFEVPTGPRSWPTTRCRPRATCGTRPGEADLADSRY